MTLSKYILASLSLSLILHLLLILTLSEMEFKAPGVASFKEENRQFDFTLHNIKLPEPAKKHIDNKISETDNSYIKKSNSEIEREIARNEKLNEEIRDLFRKEQLTPRPPEPAVRFAGLEKAKLTPKLPEAPAERKASAPRPTVIEIDMATLPPARIGNRRLSPKLERIDVPDIKLPSLLPHGPAVEGIAPTYDVGFRFSPPKLGGPGFIPKDGDAPGAIEGSHTGGHILPPGDISAVGLPENSQNSVIPFDEFVDISVKVKDDVSTGGGYFLVSIKANEKFDTVKEIPKDVMIIIDRSTSIAPRKFQAFRDAAINALDYLNQADCFNIVTFTDKPYAMSAKYLPATKENRKKAAKFIKSLTRGGTTSVFAGLQPFVGNATDGGRPLNIFLLTDGISTVNIYDDDVFLRQILDINRGHVSIFPFSAGNDANRELLDFLGFLNRGISFHSGDIASINSNLSDFIINHSSLLIRDIQYYAAEHIVKNIYPRKLQHLYRNSDVKIHGYFGPGDTELVLKIIGRDSSGMYRDVIFRCNFADCPRTKDELDKEWAAKKIIQLLADKTLSSNPVEKRILDTEIRRLSAIHNMAVPY